MGADGIVRTALGESVTDDNRFADIAHEAQTFAGDGGARLSRTITDWPSQTTLRPVPVAACRRSPRTSW